MHSLLDKHLPMWRVKNILIFYILSGVYNAWFVAGVWVFIWGKFMSNTQIGIADALCLGVGFLIELPSGVFADAIGRKKAIVMGNIFLFVGNLFVALSSSFVGITGWYLVWTIGYAFQSGSTEALAYDSLRRAGYEKDWNRVIATSTVIAKTASLIAIALGGLLFTVWFRLPYIAFAAISLIGVIAALFLDEIKVERHENTWSFRFYLRQIRDGVSVLSRPNVLPMAIMCLSITGIAFIYNWGLLRPLTATRFGYIPEAYAILLSVISFVCIVAISQLPRIRKKFKLEYLLMALTLIYSVIFLVMGFDHQWVIGGLIMMALSVILLYIDALFSEFINIHTHEEHRATTLSAVALFTKLPYILLAVFIGRIADAGLMQQLTLVIGVVALVIWLVSFGLFKRSELKKAF